MSNSDKLFSCNRRTFHPNHAVKGTISSITPVHNFAKGFGYSLKTRMKRLEPQGPMNIYKWNKPDNLPFESYAERPAKNLYKWNKNDNLAYEPYTEPSAEAACTSVNVQRGIKGRPSESERLADIEPRFPRKFVQNQPSALQQVLSDNPNLPARVINGLRLFVDDARDKEWVNFLIESFSRERPSPPDDVIDKDGYICTQPPQWRTNFDGIVAQKPKAMYKSKLEEVLATRANLPDRVKDGLKLFIDDTSDDEWVDFIIESLSRKRSWSSDEMVEQDTQPKISPTYDKVASGPVIYFQSPKWPENLQPPSKGCKSFKRKSPMKDDSYWSLAPVSKRHRTE